MKNMFKFADLIFHPLGLPGHDRPAYPEGRWMAFAPIGDFELSVVFGPGNYSTVEDGAVINYEVAVRQCSDQRFVPLSGHDAVIGWRTPEEIDELIKEIFEDPGEWAKRQWCKVGVQVPGGDFGTSME
jgi:hypothetical protein